MCTAQPFQDPRVGFRLAAPESREGSLVERGIGHSQPQLVKALAGLRAHGNGLRETKRSREHQLQLLCALRCGRAEPVHHRQLVELALLRLAVLAKLVPHAVRHVAQQRRDVVLVVHLVRVAADQDHGAARRTRLYERRPARLLLDHLPREHSQVLPIPRLPREVPNEEVQRVLRHKDRQHLLVLLMPTGVISQKIEPRSRTCARITQQHPLDVQADRPLVNRGEPVFLRPQHLQEGGLPGHGVAAEHQLQRECRLRVVVQIEEVEEQPRHPLLLHDLRQSGQLRVAFELQRGQALELCQLHWQLSDVVRAQVEAAQ